MPLSTTNPNNFLLDGESLQPEELMALSHGRLKLSLSSLAHYQIAQSRKVVDTLAASDGAVYGINTGFGNFASVQIAKDQLSKLQVNLITSHAAGVGKPVSIQKTRMLLVLRINVFAKGYSGISPETVQRMLDAFNNGCISYVPEQGTVGASGDLAQLSHLALGMLGIGKMYDPKLGDYDDAAAVLLRYGLTPITLGPKEGLAMINGTQFITALGVEALVRSEMLVKLADVVGALSLECLQGTPKAFDPRIHQARPHVGQILSAQRLRTLLHREGENESEIFNAHVHYLRVQDSYSLRCQPQVHGAAGETCRMVRQILVTEMNSATDNPMIFIETGTAVSGGNFHAEIIAKFLDYLCIGVHELASISERRIERLVNPILSSLPAFLVQNGGLNSGFMICHCTCAALVSENKQLCNPASVDSIPTSAAQEDHVSMGGWAARKCLQVVENVEKVLAIELMAACQALEFHRPKKSTAALEKVHALVRTKVPKYDEDRFVAPDIEAVHQLIRSGAVWNVVANDLNEPQMLFWE